MWTTSSSRGSRSAVLAVALLAAGGAAADEPRPALTRIVRKPKTVDNAALRRPVELRSATLVALDPALTKLAGEAFVTSAAAPAAVDVRTAEPIDITPRTSWPVVLLDGRPVEHTRLDPAQLDRLVAFLPDRSRLGRDTRVEVYWVGNEERTRTRRPLILRVEAPIN